MNQKQKEILEQYAQDDNIKGVVATDTLDNEGYELGYLRDVTSQGCVSGSCSGLIYYADTHAFYDKYSNECDKILEELEDSTGEGFRFNGQDVRNTLAWLGYEERARELLDELENNEN